MVLQSLQASGAMTLGELYHLTEIPKPTLLRILKTLMEEGAIWQRMADNAYVPSFALARLTDQMSKESEFVEVTSQILHALSEEVKWPSVLAIPRHNAMEVIETNVRRAEIDHVALGPIGFRINILRSSSGRAYLSFCEDAIRRGILNNLQLSTREGDRLARNESYISNMLRETRAQGYALRHPDFGGHYDLPRSQSDDGRESLAIPIRLGNHVPGTINITWSKQVFSRAEAVERFLTPLKRAAKDIEGRIQNTKNLSHINFT